MKWGSAESAEPASSGPPGSQPRLAGPELFHPVVRRFFRDLHVVDVALAHAGRGDANQLRLALQRGDVGRAAVAHARAQSADELMDHGANRPAMGDARLDTLGYELLGRVRPGGFEVELVLEVAVAAAAAHRAER